MRKDLATLYRPRKIEDLIGQPDVVKQLTGAFKTKEIPNAFLLSGHTGCGKTTTARMIARYVMCEKMIACGKCKACATELTSNGDYREHNCGEHGKIEDIRGLLAMSRNLPQIGKFRVIVLDEAHKLTGASAEALLKPIEEPAAKTLWILATTDPEALKPTLRNRCVPLRLKTVDKETLTTHLLGVCKKEDIKLPKAALAAVSEVSGGFVRESLTILQGVAQVVAGTEGKKTDEEWEAIVKEAALQAGGHAVSLVATKLVISMLLGKVKPILSVLADMDESIPLTNKVVQFSQFALDTTYKVSGKNVWWSVENRAFLEELGRVLKKMDKKLEVRDIPPSVVFRTLQAVITLRAEMQRFAVGGHERSLMASVLIEAALKNKKEAPQPKGEE